jgi:hypothetical protein
LHSTTSFLDACFFLIGAFLGHPRARGNAPTPHGNSSACFGGKLTLIAHAPQPRPDTFLLEFARHAIEVKARFSSIGRAPRQNANTDTPRTTSHIPKYPLLLSLYPLARLTWTDSAATPSPVRASAVGRDRRRPLARSHQAIGHRTGLRLHCLRQAWRGRAAEVSAGAHGYWLSKQGWSKWNWSKKGRRVAQLRDLRRMAAA